jgi:putative restriction endonuclease
MDDVANTGVRLAARAKGIYKPRYTDYALSVRQTLDSPYADKEVIRRSGGSWVYSYYKRTQTLLSATGRPRTEVL